MALGHGSAEAGFNCPVAWPLGHGSAEAGFNCPVAWPLGHGSAEARFYRPCSMAFRPWHILHFRGVKTPAYGGNTIHHGKRGL